MKTKRREKINNKNCVVFRLAPPTQLTPQSVEDWYLALRAVLLQASQVYKKKEMTLRAQEDVMHTSGQELVSKLRDDLREFRVVVSL